MRSQSWSLGGRQLFLLLGLLLACLFSLLPTVVAQQQQDKDAAAAALPYPTRITEQQKTNDFLENEFDDYDDSTTTYHLRHLQTTTATETTRVNIWQKLKESLGWTIIGFILIICMPCAIWKNEGRHVRELVRIDFAKNKAIEVDW